ncbi:hypothetical protein V1264_024516 [Littorina saxatilis]|uniref:OTU domain-containing protein n=1 Tax=Littorina saxatilis TaxID=31220 RepID=A0AAN9G0I3_9CAEN
MESDDESNSVYLQLATSFTSQMDTTGAFNSSDEEPLITKVTQPGFDSSDEEPLITKQVRGHGLFNSSDEEPLILKTGPNNDSTLMDPTYLPSDETEWSDELENHLHEPRGKRLRKLHKKMTPVIDIEMAQAGDASKKTHDHFLKAQKTHKSRLDNLLCANGLQRQEIAPDGNCFFNAAVEHFEDITHLELRTCLCNQLSDNFGTYINFIGNFSTEDENERFLRYFFNVQELRSPGKWSNDAADLLPQALADWSERVVRIYSSDPFTPVIDVLPTTGNSDDTSITLAFVAHEPTHYDACHVRSRPGKVTAKSATTPSTADQDSHPVNPSAPDQDSRPVTPSAPDQDSRPVTPSAHDQDYRPVTPSAHDQDSRPVTSSVPDQDAHPVNPSAPDQDSRPVNPSTPDQDSRPVTSSAPDQDSRPVTPSAHDQDSRPVNPSTPDQDSHPVNPSAHDQDSRPVNPSTPDQDAHPVNPSAPDQDSRPVTPSAPGQDSRPVTPSTPDQLDSRPLAPVDTAPITPRKQGSYNTPPKKRIVRKREAEPEKWKKNVRKVLHLEGKEYISQNGSTVPAKTMGPVDCSKCRYRCTQKMSSDQRLELFQTFYALGTYERQKDFVCTNVKQKKTVTILGEDNQPSQKKRQVCRVFTFTVEGTVHRVCKKFFLSTLAKGETYVDHALENTCGGVFCATGRRGKAPPHNKFSEESVNQATEHISSFPVVESHYTRKDTQRMYLPSNLTIKKMYDLYLERCQQQEQRPVSQKKYRQIFNENFNYSFHTPKKDQCAICVIHDSKLKQGTASDEEKQRFKEHIDRKNRARDEKDGDKREATANPSKHVVTIDLQAVLQAPCGLVSQLYYKRKLSVYNFTVYSLADKKGTCFTWDESEGKRGSCEIATCLYIYLSSLPKSVEEVTIFSDCCSGQNRNQYLAAAMVHAVNNISNIKVIRHKYLETGHTQMECDSMHSAITFAKKHTPIYTPCGWDIILRMARRGQPYVVIPLKHTDFLDVKQLACSAVRNTKTDINGQRVNWLTVKCLQFVQGEEELLYLKTSFDEEEYRVLRLVTSGKRGRTSSLTKTTIVPRYSSKLPISEAKKRDLLSLCKSAIIPEQHHDYYKALPSSTSAADKLPEPDFEEEDADSD